MLSSSLFFLFMLFIIDIRALLEKSLSSIPTHKGKELWSRFLQFESKYGDLASIKKIEARLMEASGEQHTSITDLLDRLLYLDLLPCGERDYDGLGKSLIF